MAIQTFGGLFFCIVLVASAHSCNKYCKPPSGWDLDDGPCIDLRSEPDMLTAYKTMITKLADYYAYTDWRGIDWAGVQAVGISDARLANDTGKTWHLQVAVNKVIAMIPDGHMEHIFLTKQCGPAAVQEFTKIRDNAIAGGYGITIAPLEDGTVILTHVVPDSQAAKAGLRIGEQVTHLNNVPIVNAVQERGIEGWMWTDRNPATAANRLQEQYRAVVRAKVGSTSNWTLAAHGHVALVAIADDYLTWNITLPKNSYITGVQFGVKFRILPSGFGYIAINDMEIKHHKKVFTKAVKALAATPGMIVDIRGNDGGDDDQGADFNGYFLPQQSSKQFYEDASFSNRLLKDIGAESMMNGTNLSDYAILGKSNRLFTKPESPSYTKPVVLIVNSETASTGEGVAKGFANLPRSRSQVVGFEGTCGSFGMSGGTILLPGDFGLQFPFGRSLDADGQIQLDSDKTISGGIMPTKMIQRNSSNVIDFVQGGLTTTKNIELDVAEEVLAEMIAQQPKGLLI